MSPEELDALILGHLSGTLSEAEARELQGHLDAHPADAARLLDASDHELLFREAFKAPVAARKTRGRRFIPASGSGLSWGAAIAAAGLVAGLIAVATWMGSGPAPDEIARALNARRAQAERDAREELIRIFKERIAAEQRLEDLRRRTREVVEEKRPEAELALLQVERAKTEEILERSHAEEREAREDLESANRPAGHATRVAAMTVEIAEGDAYVTRENGRDRAKPGAPIQAGQGIEVAGAKGRLVVAYPDGTRVELAGAGAVRDLREDAAGKHAYVARGRVTAEVMPQPAGRPMVFQSPHAEARVLGTLLSLAVDKATLLEVRQGKVRFTKPAAAAKAVEVSGGEYSVAAEGKDLSVARLETLWRVIEGNEEASNWTLVSADPMSVALSGDQAASGRKSLRLAYSWRDPAKGGKGWAIATHPVKFGAADAYLSFRVYIQACDETVKLGAMTWLDDEGAWHMGDVRLDKCPKQTWFTFAVPLRAGAKKNNPKGGSVYDADRVVGCGLSLVGGSATVYVDDVTLSPDAPPAARGPKR